MKLKKGVKKSFKIAIIAVVAIVLVGMGYLAYKRFFDNDKPTSKVKVEEKIDTFGYVLEETETKLYKNLFKELVTVLNKDEIDEEAYARLVAQLLVADFYNLDNKVSKNDVGGVQFLKESLRDNFVLEASETVYKYIEHNIYGDRDQVLPIIKNVEIKTMEQTTYKYNDIEDNNTYKGIVTIEYEEDLGYPTEVTVVMIHNDKKLEVVKMY